MSAGPALTVELRLERAGPRPAAEVAVVAVVTNAGDAPARLNRAQAAAAPLVLEVEGEDGRRVSMRPPDIPRPGDGGAGEPLEPGAAATFRYAGFLDRSQPPGRYRVRYHGAHPAQGAGPDGPLSSGWVEVAVAPHPEALEGHPPLPALRPPLPWWRRAADAIVCPVRRLLQRERCEGLLTRSVDEARCVEITGAAPGFEAWNGAYAWRARFRVRVDQARCRIIVTVRVRVVGGADEATRDGWERAIEGAWGDHAVLVCRCCCRGGYAIAANLVFVDAGEDYVVHAGPDTASLGIWGRGDAASLADEFGRMIGARDEYYTVDGAEWGEPFRTGAGIMNNPGELPLARHFELVQRAAEELMGTACRVRAGRLRGRQR